MRVFSSRPMSGELHPQSGAALVELTVVLALFMVPLLMGLVEAGRLIYTYEILVHQAHHTAR